jgi:hypothetical protein
MSYLLDDVARTLARPTTPRRELLKLLVGLVAAAILGSVGIGRAVAQDEAACRGVPCTGVGDPTSCSSGEKCVECPSRPGKFICRRPKAAIDDHNRDFHL